MTKYLMAIMACCFLSMPCIYSDVPTAQFLLIGQGARAEALGGAAVSNCFDYSSTYWNPAASAFLKQCELGLNYDKLPAEISGSFLAFIYPYKTYAFGIHGIGESTKADSFDANGNSLGEESENNTNINLTVARKITDNLSLGAGIGFTSMKICDIKGSAGNFNLGAIQKIGRMSLGAMAANLGGKIKFPDSDGESQPALIRAGCSYSLLRNSSLLLAASYEKIFSDDNSGGIGAGVEYRFIEYFLLRGGTKFQNDGTVRPSFGFGLNFKSISLDYAFTMSSSELEQTSANRIGLSAKFGNVKKEIEKTEKPAKSGKPEEKPAELPQEPPVEKIESKPVEKIEKQTGQIINLAVADFSGKNVSAADASIVGDFLRTELVRLGTYNVIEKANMDKILAEAAFQQSGCTTAECAVQIGKILNVQQMAVGTLSKLMDTYYITVNLVDVETGRILASDDESATSAKELRSACRKLAKNIGR